MEDYEIRDVMRRGARPDLDIELLRASWGSASTVDGGYERPRVQFAVVNTSAAVASFAVVTIATAKPHTLIDYAASSPWSASDELGHYQEVRCAVASGSFAGWSPITPGFRLVLPLLQLNIRALEADTERPRVIGIVRLDHDGGMRIRHLVFSTIGGPLLALGDGFALPPSWMRQQLPLPPGFATV
jgi:hypothetical protein